MENDESETEKRPNSNYRISNSSREPSSEQELNFYYSREHRLASAPQSVKDLYKEETVKPRFALLGSLIADKPRRALFFVIIILCVLIFLLTRTGFFDDNYSLDGNQLEISGITVEESVIVIVRKKEGKAGSYTGAVDIAVSIPEKNTDEDMPVFYHRIYLTFERDEEFRFAVPFNAAELLIVLQSEKSTLQLSFKPK